MKLYCAVCFGFLFLIMTPLKSNPEEDLPSDYTFLISMLTDPDKRNGYDIESHKGYLFSGASRDQRKQLAILLATTLDARFGSKFFEIDVEKFCQSYTTADKDVHAFCEQALEYVQQFPGKKAILFLDNFDFIAHTNSDHQIGKSVLYSLLLEFPKLSEDQVYVIGSVDNAQHINKITQTLDRFTNIINLETHQKNNREAHGIDNLLINICSVL